MPEVKYSGVSPSFEKWLSEAAKHHASMAAGDRAAVMSEAIMRIGSAKLLYSIDLMGLDISKYAVIFAPDGTFSMNRIRTKRGFSYGSLMIAEYDDYLFLHNAMPNGCGYTLAKIHPDITDQKLEQLLLNARKKLNQDVQLATGNHFAGAYYAKDPLSGEDTGERYVLVHCSGHVGGPKLYDVSWLQKEPGYEIVHTPHGKITVLTDEAREKYLEYFEYADKGNAENREKYLLEIFEENEFEIISSLTHQGLLAEGTQHRLGVQKVIDNLMPVAFNPEEGIALLEGKPNLKKENIIFLKKFGTDELSISQKLIHRLNLVPHGAGYEYKEKIKKIGITLNKEGIENIMMEFFNTETVTVPNMRGIRDKITYRRKTPIMKQVAKFDLAEHILDLPYFYQIYPVKSIPGGLESKRTKVLQE